MIRLFNIDVAQDINDVALLEELIRWHSVVTVFELGCWKGGLSLYLKCLSYNLGFQYYGFDLNAPESTQLGALIKLDESIRNIDIFSTECIDFIKWKVEHSGGRVLIICDNGNKVQEFKTYAPLLRSGDIIAVHDWGSEITEQDIADVVTNLNLQPIEFNFRLFKVYSRL